MPAVLWWELGSETPAFVRLKGGSSLHTCGALRPENEEVIHCDTETYVWIDSCCKLPVSSGTRTCCGCLAVSFSFGVIFLTFVCVFYDGRSPDSGPRRHLKGRRVTWCRPLPVYRLLRFSDAANVSRVAASLSGFHADHSRYRVNILQPQHQAAR